MAGAGNKTELDAEVARALRAVGADASERVLDGITDPLGAARALAAQGGAPALLRAAPELGAGRSGQAPDESYGPAPADPVWLRLTGEAPASLKIAPVRLAGGGAAESSDDAGGARVARVVVEAREHPCCDAPGCDRRRAHVTAWLAFEGGADAGRAARPRLLVAEARGLDAARAEAVVEAFAARLARSLGVPLETGHGTEPADAIAARSMPDRDDEEAPSPLDAGALARFSMRSEGEPLVLRDHGSVGPRSSAARNIVIGVLLLAAAVPLWIQVARSATAGDSGVAVGLGAAAALISLTGYAFVGVARFSARYVARSSPLLWLTRDRFVVAPWVDRAGRIDLKPEGRFGAAIPVGELREVRAVARGELWSVELDTDHGPMDVMTVSAEEVARYWAVNIARAMASVRHPGGPSARQRLRARAKGQAEGSKDGAAQGGAAPR